MIGNHVERKLSGVRIPPFPPEKEKRSSFNFYIPFYNDVKAALLMLLSTLLFAFMLLFPKLAHTYYKMPTLNTAFWPVLFAFLASIVLSVLKKSTWQVWKVQKKNYNRSFGILAGIFILSFIFPPFLVMALVRIPIADFSVISYLTPPIVIILSYIFFKETLHLTIIGFFIQILGLWFLLPKIHFGLNIIYLTGYIFALGYVGIQAIHTVCMKHLHRYLSHPLINLFFQVGMVISTFLWAVRTFEIPSLPVLILSMLTGFSGLVSIYLYIMAIATGRLIVSMAMMAFLIPISLVLEIIFFGHYPPYPFYLGTLIILLGAFIASYKQKMN